jgi:hypothetical protein
MAVDYSVEEQRRMSVEQIPALSGTITTRFIHNVQGKTVAIGEIAPQRGRAQNPEFEKRLVSMRARHAKTGITPATIINMLPLPLVVNSPMADLRVRIPACIGSHLDFTAYTWVEPTIEAVYAGDGIYQPFDFLPVDLAEAFQNEYYNFGGVVLILGMPTKENLGLPENVEKINLALERMYTWMMGRIVEANGFWNSPNHGAAAAIVDVHRVCATRMYEIGKIPSLPPWIQEIREQAAIDAKCPTCGMIPEAGAVKCISCNEILDPATAFLNGTITEEDASLERLTRDEVVDLGISAFVAETVDEKPSRLAEGRRKPKSIAQVRAENEQTELEEKAEAAREKRADAKAAQVAADAARNSKNEKK